MIFSMSPVEAKRIKNDLERLNRREQNQDKAHVRLRIIARIDAVIEPGPSTPRSRVNAL